MGYNFFISKINIRKKHSKHSTSYAIDLMYTFCYISLFLNLIASSNCSSYAIVIFVHFKDKMRKDMNTRSLVKLIQKKSQTSIKSCLTFIPHCKWSNRHQLVLSHHVLWSLSWFNIMSLFLSHILKPSSYPRCSKVDQVLFIFTTLFVLMYKGVH